MRVADRILAVAAAVALAALGLLVAAEIALAGVGRGPWVLPYDGWYEAARSNAWDSPGARWLSIALLAAGVALLFLQVAKAPPRSVPLPGGASPAGVSRRSVEQALSRAARRVDGVSRARASLDGDSARVVVTTTRQTGDLRAAVAETATARLRRLGLAHTPRVDVDVERKPRR